METDNPTSDGIETFGVRRLLLDSFRNYASLDLELGDGIHILSGENAQGKTNFLEALYLIATTRLLRGIRDSEAIMEEAAKAIVAAELKSTATELRVVLERGLKKRVLLNGMALPRASDVLGRMPCVCISSADLPIVSGEPSDRRLFLDLELSGLYPSYLRSLGVYKRALEQRNALLKVAQKEFVEAATFEAWEVQMAHHGAFLRQHRMRYMDSLLPFAQRSHASMGSGEVVELYYTPKDPATTEEELLNGLASCRQTDIYRGTTILGPHRDDFLLNVGGREARLYGSQGQQRTAAVSLKLATLEFDKAERGETPLLLLDDILSDLDETRRAKLMEWVLEHAGQTILTCTEPAAAGPSILSKARLYQVRSGTVSEA